MMFRRGAPARFVRLSALVLGLLAAPADAAPAGQPLLLPAGSTVLPPALNPGGRFAEARIQATSGGTGPRRALLAIRYADADNWVGAALNLTPGRARVSIDLIQVSGGQVNRLRQMGAEGAPAGSFQTLRVELAGGELAAWLDGERVAIALPAPAPKGGVALLAQDGAFAFDGLRTGTGGERPGRIALAQRSARIALQAGETQRYPLSALDGDGITPLTVSAASSDSRIAQARVEAGELVVSAHAAGEAVIAVTSTRDASVVRSIALAVGPAFAARGDAAALRGRLLPAPAAAEVQADTPLRIRFDAPPLLGSTGSVRILRAADRTVVDVIRLGEEVDAIGHAGQEFKRVVRSGLITVHGNEVVIRPHSARLDYGTEYLVLVDAGLVKGIQFEGVGETAGWRFRTRAQAPRGTRFTVDDDGAADFRTVQGALNHVMRSMPRAEPATIRIANGRYDELLYLRGKDRLTLHGESRDGVVIGAINNDGINPGAGTSQPLRSPAIAGGRSVFLVEDADLLTLDHLTIVNPTVRAASLGGQAEALHYSSDRGRLVVRDAAFLSEQDTILVRGYSWFYRSLIAGNVDFIWGTNRAALFEESEIRSVGDSAQPKGGGYIVQARTVDPDGAGFVFLNSRLTHGPGPAGNGVPPGATWLARPGPSGVGDKVVYVRCRMDVHVAPGGWSLPKQIAPGSQPGAGWLEYGSMDLAGQPLDLSPRAGGRILGPDEAARYATRARVFESFNDGQGWTPAPETSHEHHH